MKRLLPIALLIVFSCARANAQGRAVAIDGAEKIVRFYPNPAISSITFDLLRNVDRGTDIQVFNLIGKMVFEQKNIPSKTTINLTDYSRGVYIYQLRDHDGKILDSGKFQVSK
ncbi:MAG TPA: T9SS type A sorting domain-containing protein [Chitinophagaceae bacterium]